MDIQTERINGSTLLCGVCGGLMHRDKNTLAYKCDDCGKSLKLDFKNTRITMLEKSSLLISMDSSYISRLSICSHSLT
jgi:predicted RNA-binding Zn-ribbon protein involved in translation (DUF1610 family)